MLSETDWSLLIVMYKVNELVVYGNDGVCQILMTRRKCVFLKSITMEICHGMQKIKPNVGLILLHSCFYRCKTCTGLRI